MIDFKEIRVGNIVYFNLNKQGSNNTTCIVRRIDYGVWLNGIGSYLNTRFSLNDSDDTFGMPENYNPIQISEDLLFKLGFKIEHNDITKVKYYRLRPNGFRVDINKYSNTLGRDYGIHIDNLSCDSILSGDIQYLHQLQNYIYDATGEELDVKELF